MQGHVQSKRRISSWTYVLCNDSPLPHRKYTWKNCKLARWGTTSNNGMKLVCARYTVTVEFDFMEATIARLCHSSYICVGYNKKVHYFNDNIDGSIMLEFPDLKGRLFQFCSQLTKIKFCYCPTGCAGHYWKLKGDDTNCGGISLLGGRSTSKLHWFNFESRYPEWFTSENDG